MCNVVRAKGFSDVGVWSFYGQRQVSRQTWEQIPKLLLEVGNEVGSSCSDWNASASKSHRPLFCADTRRMLPCHADASRILPCRADARWILLWIMASRGQNNKRSKANSNLLLVKSSFLTINPKDLDFSLDGETRGKVVLLKRCWWWFHTARHARFDFITSRKGFHWMWGKATSG